MRLLAKHNKEQEIVTNEIFHDVRQQFTSLQMLKIYLKIKQTLNLYSKV